MRGAVGIPAAALLLVLAAPCGSSPVELSGASAFPASRSGKGPTVAIVACDSATSSWGVACASAYPACGSRIPYAAAGTGAVAALGGAGARAASAALLALARGASPKAALDSARAVPGDPEARQLGVVGWDGRAGASTGSRLPGWAGQRVGQGFACVGEGIQNAEVLDAMAAAFHAKRGDLGARLLAALDGAGRALGTGGAFGEGDGYASAAILVVRAEGGPHGESDRLADLRVDASSDPIEALARLYARHAATYIAAAHVRFGDDARRRGDNAAAEREYREAETGFRAAVAGAPKDPDALNELAWFLALHGRDPQEALRFAEAAIQARGDDPNLWDTLAEAAYRAGSLDRAIEAADRAARLARGNARYAERLRVFRSAKAALTGGSAPKDSGAGR